MKSVKCEIVTWNFCHVFHILVSHFLSNVTIVPCAMLVKGDWFRSNLFSISCLIVYCNLTCAPFSLPLVVSTHPMYNIPFTNQSHLPHKVSLCNYLSIQTILPAAAQDVYYRDEIGNISTSNLLERDDHVELELRPRFPLFGGWKTHYTMGYNLPSYEYLFSSGKSHKCRS